MAAFPRVANCLLHLSGLPAFPLILPTHFIASSRVAQNVPRKKTNSKVSQALLFSTKYDLTHSLVSIPQKKSITEKLITPLTSRGQ